MEDIKKVKIIKRFEEHPDEKESGLSNAIFSKDRLKVEEYLHQYPHEINRNLSKIGAGTLLHVQLANEVWQWIIQVLDVISSIEKNKKEFILDFTIVDRELKTLLIIAAKLRQWEFIRYLFEKFPRVVSIINKQDEDGRTALHYAALYGDLSTFLLLVRQGADVMLKDKFDERPLGNVKQESKTIINTLLSIEVHPYRSCTAPYNHFRNDKNVFLFYGPNMLNNLEQEEEKLTKVQAEMLREGLIDPTKMFYAKDLHRRTNRFRNIVDDGLVLATKDNLAIVQEFLILPVVPQKEDLGYYNKMVLDEKSVLEMCLEGQQKLLNYFGKTPVYEIIPNETIRINVDVRKKFGILSAGLGDNQIAIILRDALGNMSVTVVNDEKNLQRIPDEIKALPGELASLDIITKIGSEIGLAKKALSLYEQIQIQNSKKTKDVRTTKTGVILLTEDRMLAPDEKQVTQFKTSSETLSDKHSLVNYRPTLCRSNVSGNIHELIGEAAGVIEKRSVQPVQNIIGSILPSVPGVQASFFAGSVIPGSMVVTPGSAGGPPIGVNVMAKSADF